MRMDVTSQLCYGLAHTNLEKNHFMSYFSSIYCLPLKWFYKVFFVCEKITELNLLSHERKWKWLEILLLLIGWVCFCSNPDVCCSWIWNNCNWSLMGCHVHCNSVHVIDILNFVKNILKHFRSNRYSRCFGRNSW